MNRVLDLLDTIIQEHKAEGLTICDTTRFGDYGIRIDSDAEVVFEYEINKALNK